MKVVVVAWDARTSGVSGCALEPYAHPGEEVVL